MEKVKYEIEFILNTSTSILYKCMTTPSGLSEWFADNVNVKGDDYTFFWDGSEETAKMIKKKKGESVRFQWEDDEGEDYYFELLISVDPMTKQVALIITDFAEEDEVEDAKLLWENSISSLRQSIGC
jgi:uncharacterized protein YndB with AHSA1/START domain